MAVNDGKTAIEVLVRHALSSSLQLLTICVRIPTPIIDWGLTSHRLSSCSVVGNTTKLLSAGNAPKLVGSIEKPMATLAMAELGRRHKQNRIAMGRVPLRIFPLSSSDSSDTSDLPVPMIRSHTYYQPEYDTNHQE